MPEPSAPSVRRHDLDALRSFAMLLGIALHAALAYVGAGWVVNDAPASQTLGALVTAIHGFRMPLFFLLSGFFTAMLWQRRGLAGLLTQRTKRVLIPLAIACTTIIPTMWSVNAWAIRQQTVQIRETSQAQEETTAPRAPSPDIWTVAAFGDMQGLRAFAQGDPNLDAQDPNFGVTPLGWTAIKNTPEATAYLIEIGANPNALYKDGNTPMHTACFFGRADVAEHLIRAGADLTIKSYAGEVPADSMRHNQQTTEFIANMVRVPIDFTEVAAGRDRIRALIDAGALAQDKAAALQPAGSGSNWLITQLTSGVFFQHLWFLWFLCWLNAAFAIFILITRALPTIKLPKTLVASPLALVWLVPVTMVFQLQMHAGGTTPGFGPDTSAGLMPMWHVLGYYAVFFAFGAIVYTARGPSARLGRFWYVALPVAFVLLPVGMTLAYDTERARSLIADESVRHWCSAGVQVLYAWLMTFGLMGLCEALLGKGRQWVRFVSDSSYWLYLVHLPLIILGQGLLLRVEMPALVEFGVLTAVTFAVLLVSYRYCVRYTPIGTMLNGRRVREGAIAAAAQPATGA
ncbi:MAG: acyltransferase family protein [Phycisphaerales bacterium]|nr:acyltransferase family protein [Phycisphaerales bacterium]MCB9835316.1 acyltransferase family protein [Phycisphaera sp.]